MNKKVIIIIAVVVLLVLLLGGGAAFYFLVLNNQDSGPPPPYEPEELVSQPFTEVIVSNLAGGEIGPHVIRLHPELGLDAAHEGQADFVTSFATAETTYRDLIFDILRKETYESMSTVDSKPKMAIEIRDALNEYLKEKYEYESPENLVWEVRFKDFMVQ